MGGWGGWLGMGCGGGWCGGVVDTEPDTPQGLTPQGRRGCLKHNASMFVIACYAKNKPSRHGTWGEGGDPRRAFGAQ